MNSKTAKLINRVARSMIGKVRDGSGMPVSGDRLVQSLKAKWKGSTHRERGVLRRQLAHHLRMEG